MQLIECFMFNVALEMASMRIFFSDVIFEPSFSKKTFCVWVEEGSG